MRTSEVARQAHVNPQTLRYYKRRGLRVVRFVKRAQELGFTLADVEALLELADGGPEGTCPAGAHL